MERPQDVRRADEGGVHQESRRRGGGQGGGEERGAVRQRRVAREGAEARAVDVRHGAADRAPWGRVRDGGQPE
eukprot:30886-Pelagococcus_subviridis.AAC.14